jgi:hypothetical protein
LKAPYHSEYSTYRWPKTSSSDLEPRHEIARDFYKYGDSIMTFEPKTDKINTIKIPATTLTGDSTCHYLTEPIKFLNSKKFNCLKSLQHACDSNNKLLHQFLNSQLFRRPSKLTETREAFDVFSINIQACKRSSINCTQILIEDISSTDEIELLGGDELFDEIRMEFYINDTIISSANVTLFSHEDLVCGVDELAPTKVIQKFDIQFININEKLEKRIRKNSRGYNDEELIVASRLRPVNESNSDGEKVLDFFRNDTKVDSSFNMKIPDSQSGKCVLNEKVHDLIRFNENSLTVCNVELIHDEKRNETVCQQFQRQIIHFLFNTLNFTANYTHDDVYVSKFWSPRYDVASWSIVNVQNSPEWSLEAPAVSDKMFTCSNLATSIKYSFISSQVRASRTRKYENIINSVEVEFGQIDEFKFQIDDENQTTIEIQIQVLFLNAAENLLKSFAASLMIDLKIFLISSLLLAFYYL